MENISVTQIRKDVHGICKILGEQIVSYPENAETIVKKVNTILRMYENSALYLLSEDHLAGVNLDCLEEILHEARRLNREYEEFLKMVGLARIQPSEPVNESKNA